MLVYSPHPCRPVILDKMNVLFQTFYESPCVMSCNISPFTNGWNNDTKIVMFIVR